MASFTGHRGVSNTALPPHLLRSGCCTELPAASCATFLHIPEVLEQNRDSFLHDAGVRGHCCQGLQAALLQGAEILGALFLPL